jgi:protein-tyrosine phosphatase
MPVGDAASVADRRGRVIDLHSHLLPGVDDGSPSLDNSLRVLERFVGEGIAEVACTPHLNATDARVAPVEVHRRLLAELRYAAGNAIRLHEGFEIMLDQPGCDLRLPGLALGGSRAVLVEFPRNALPDGATGELLRIRTSGLIPVVAHPERYRGISIDKLHIWRDVGAVIQGDGMMLLSSGQMAEMSRAMLRAGVFDILASDNHGDRRSLATVRLWLKEMGADSQGRLLTEENPRRLLRNEMLERVPPLPSQTGLWQRLRALFTRR